MSVHAGSIRFHTHDGHRLVVTELARSGPVVEVRHGSSAEPERHVHASDDDARADLERRIQALVAEGAQPPVAADPAHEAWFQAELFPLLGRDFGAAPRETAINLRARIEAHHGLLLPPQLDHFFRVHEEQRLRCDFGEWRIGEGDLLLPDPAAGNLCEQLIARDQDNYLGTSLREYLAGLVPVGSAGNGDVYFAALEILHPENAQVMLWDHEERALNDFADSLASLAELNRLHLIDAGELEVEGDPIAALRRDMPRLAGRVAPSWHYREVVEHAGVALRYEGSIHPRFLYYRAGWLDALLSQRGGRGVQSAAELFRQWIEWHERVPWESVRDYATLLLPTRGLYWLFYLFFFDREAALRECIDRVRRSPSPLLRDAAALVEELAGGRAELGKIRDVQELRRRWLALDLDPARAAARAAERSARKAARKARQAADRALAEELARGDSLPALTEAAWTHRDNPEVLPRLNARLAELDPALALDLARVAAFAGGGRREWEKEDIALALHDADPAAAPAMLASGDHRLLPVAAALAPTRVEATVRAGLASRNLWTRCAAVEAGVVSGVLGVADLLACVERWTWQDERREPRAEPPGVVGEFTSALGPVQPDEPPDEAPAGEPGRAAEATEEAEPEVEEVVLATEPAVEAEPEEEDEPEEDEPEAAAEDEPEAEAAEEDDDDDDDDAPPPADEGDDLVDKPAYLRQIENKEALIAAVRALGRLGDPAAIPALVELVQRGPAVARVPAIVALGGLGSAARPHLEALLAGQHAGPALHALACLRDPAALPAIDAHLARFAGHPLRTLYDRLMRAAVAEAAGLPVDRALVELALGTVLPRVHEALELHRVAIDLAARTFPKDQAVAAIAPFLDAEQPALRRDARAALARLGAPVTPRWCDPVAAERLRERGPAALREALRDPATIGRVHLVRAAEGLGDALAPDLVAAVEHLARFEHYGHPFVRATHTRTAEAIAALARIAGAGIDAALQRLRGHPSVLVRAVDTFARMSDDLERRLSPLGDPTLRSPRLATGDARPIDIELVSRPAWLLGADIHGLALLGDRLAVAGAGRSLVFDREGAPPEGPPLAETWAYDIALDPAGRVLALAAARGRLTLHDADTGALLRELSGHRGDVRKAMFSPSGRLLASASDDRTLRVWDADTGALQWTWTEPYDINTVAWLGEDTLVYGTDRHLGVVARGGARARRIAVGGVAEVRIVGDAIVAGTARLGLVWLDPATLRRRRALPPRDVARLRPSPDGRHLWVACWQGEHVGLSRWDLATGAHEQLSDEPLFALEVGADGRCWTGGKRQRVDLRPRDPAADAVLQHTTAIAAIEGDAWTLDDAGQALRWSLPRRAADRRLAPARPLPGARALALAPEGRTAHVASSGRISAIAGDATLWSRSTARIERVALVGDALVIGAGTHLAWLDPTSGATLAERPGVVRGWVHYLLPIDGERLLVAGYDDPRLQVWSVRERRKLGELKVPRHHDDGRSARAYGMTLAPRSRQLLVSYWNETLDCIDLERPGVVTTLRTWHAYEHLAVDPGEQVIAAGNDHALTFLDRADGRVLGEQTWPVKLTAMRWLAGGDLLCGFADGSLRALRLA